METVYTPRVKDGRISNDSPQKHYYGKTAQKFGHSNHNYHFKYILFDLVQNKVHKKERKYRKLHNKMSRIYSKKN
jgi:hypothetical protein